MRIDEAITKLEELAEYYMSLKRESYEPALRLGIEALERLNEIRKANPDTMRDLAYLSCLEFLPSEGEK